MHFLIKDKAVSPVFMQELGIWVHSRKHKNPVEVIFNFPILMVMASIYVPWGTHQKGIGGKGACGKSCVVLYST